ncbi:hypothetical protein B0A52_09057 [Exophiala mesophila]|uniref:Uncharacterized protein n=1 Tax=Exophiala mesophila TaxID=212818 RepID=A0A438MTC2_EXOME|nr:hypothetical protein B0A52_09057 [Exophiala mesophila]
MAFRPIFTRLTWSSSSIFSRNLSLARPREFHLSTVRFSPTAATIIPNASNTIVTPPPPQASAGGNVDRNDASHAAFLGEADSNDGHDAVQAAYGEPPPALDASNAAFLGEADSDNAFEARKAAEGDKYEPMDASQSAYLGEADSDDGFESDMEIHPEAHRHKIDDASVSGLHGQSGEQDQRIE